ncbi:unnamed protein product [Cylindrotheca closterium]|uniref:Reverse transcriptase Ty1/copia-type domain-containing protein n=1 Tax=Cylindrotheca closterium TaxID=2856 RepID=A0AAD2G1U9_9STRA|nr:unnamed protein product [Cylindrotheca closterium]
MKSRIIGAIVLDPRNLTGRYNFMSLETGREINGRVTTAMPITDDVIKRVEELGLEQQQPYRESKMLRYEWRPGQPITADDIVAPAEAAQDPLILPEPIVINLPNAEPNPFVPIDVDDLPGADEIETELPDNQEEQGAETQGAQVEALVENQGAQNDMIENQGAQNDMIEENDESEDDDFSAEMDVVDDETKDEPDADDLGDTKEDVATADETEDGDQIVVVAASNPEDKERRGGHLDTNEGEDFGRGKRERKPAEKYSALQTTGIKKTSGKIKGKVSSFQRRKRAAHNKKRSKTSKSLISKGSANKKKAKRKRISFSFLNKRFEDLEKEEKVDFFTCAWEEHQLTGKTHLLERYTTGLAFAQMSAKQGIKKYDKEAELKLIAEFAQLLEFQVFHGVKADGPDGISFEEKRGAGDMINLIEEKINRGHTDENPVLRARSVFNGRVQRGIYTKDETASPTVDQDSLFITCIVDAIEGRFKATSDVRGAYLNAKMKDRVIMRISGPEVDIFCDLDPSLREFVTVVKGKKVLYVQLDRALYGCVKSSMLWYELYSETLMDMGFKLNPYDLCVANCDIDGKQCTICWYVDDNKISHMKLEVVKDIIRKIEAKFGKMTNKFGEEHEFLGMKITYKDGKVEISMKKHIQKAIDMFMDDINREATLPAKTYLFDVREAAKDLSEERADNFHSVTASLLYVSRRCRLDIQTAIGYLCTRVGCPDEDDWVKLKRVLQYLKGSIDLTRIKKRAANSVKNRALGAIERCEASSWWR